MRRAFEVVGKPTLQPYFAYIQEIDLIPYNENSLSGQGNPKMRDLERENARLQNN